MKDTPDEFLSDIWILVNVHGMDGDELGIISNRLRNELLLYHTEEELNKLAYGHE
jgi:hypothetical protein